MIFNIKQLPEGLRDYYDQHWKRLMMKTQSRALILCLLAYTPTPISCKCIASIVSSKMQPLDQYDALEVLEEWIQFLREQFLEEETCYSIYHKSFAEFLQLKTKLMQAKSKLGDIQQLGDIQKHLSNYTDRLLQQVEQKETEDDDEDGEEE
jgi:hypothetical protein